MLLAAAGAAGATDYTSLLVLLTINALDFPVFLMAINLLNHLPYTSVAGW